MFKPPYYISILGCQASTKLDVIRVKTCAHCLIHIVAVDWSVYYQKLVLVLDFEICYIRLRQSWQAFNVLIACIQSPQVGMVLVPIGVKIKSMYTMLI